MRTLGTTVKSLIEGNNFRSVELIEFEFDTSIYLTNNSFDIVASTVTSGGAKTYQGQGDFLNFEYAKETDELRVNSLTITLSGVGGTWTNIALNTNFLFRNVTVYKAFLNSDYSIVDDPVMIHRGILTGASVADSGETSTVSFQTANQFFDFERTAGRRTNVGSQKAFFPSDTGLRFAGINYQDVKWGKP